MSVETRPAPHRVLSIDILRGITIAVMILVNDPGDWFHVYPQLDHSAWNGCTLTDLVFPTFLFLVGCSTILSTQSRLARGDTRSAITRNILRRSLSLFLLDLLLAAFPHFHLTHLRLYGVLTRIALCYLIVALICLYIHRVSRLLAIVGVLLVGYWVLLRFVPIPGLGRPTIDFPLLDPDRNLVAWIDRGVTAFLQRTLHTGVLFEGTRDPEGLLSTLPAVATTLFGAVTARWIRKTRSLDVWQRSPPVVDTSLPQRMLERWYPRTEEHRRDGLLAFGLLNLFAGLVWSHWFPLNKKLWTSSFVLYTSGCSMLALTVLFWLYDIRRLQRKSRLLRLVERPALIYGANAIAAYVVSVLLVETLLLLHVAPGSLPVLPPPTHLLVSGVPITAWLWIYRHLFALHSSTELTSFLFAMAFVAVCFLPNLLLWRRRIFLRL